MYQERDFLILHFQSGDSPIAAMLELHLVRWITAEPPLSSRRGRRRRALRRTLPAPEPQGGVPRRAAVPGASTMLASPMWKRPVRQGRSTPYAVHSELSHADPAAKTARGLAADSAKMRRVMHYCG